MPQSKVSVATIEAFKCFKPFELIKPFAPFTRDRNLGFQRSRRFGSTQPAFGELRFDSLAALLTRPGLPRLVYRLGRYDFSE